MPYSVLEKKINSLNAEQRQSVFDYVNFLVEQNNVGKEKKTIRRTPGGLSGAFYMADDFDETPECFRDYV
ncbi:DUF2281 domain-containing protein [Treponema parvum]|uniref:DUF2281 domain-containing protein n=1 Tax=Treponema parvum TaxID=138851 RepID=A0A975F3F4_9SPIR|nr:DUF2281 domain-containing protein [Treponema parvum]QTQ13613.1 DUF2281 domain-containing protein [Treponema parvum]QTQ15833.1 DUF2281 domain-containing protein [Treponema parvum]